jgi:ATP-dependent protease ClpP protease subunit
MEHYIRFEGSITPETTSRLVGSIERAREDGATKIVILFSSLGGSIYDGFLVASTIETSKVPIQIHATNHVDSIANVIYLSAQERTAETYAKFYLHGASTGVMSMDEPTLLDQLSSLRTNNHRIAHYIAEHSEMAFAKVRTLMSKGTTMNAQEALKYKITHKLVHIEINPESPMEEIVVVLPQRRNGDPNA